MVKSTEVGEDIWDLDISRWGDVAIMDVGKVVIMAPNDTAYKRWSCHKSG